MRYRFIAAVTALLTASAAVAAPPAPPQAPPQADAAEMARHAAEMCQDRLAHATGEMAYLETRLALTDAQKPLFERWKKIKLTAAKAADCAPPPAKPSPVEGLKQEEKMLRQRLDAVKAELPALEALAASLSEEQLKVLAPHHGPHPGGPEAGGPDAPHGPHGGGHGGHGPEQGDQPPPPPEN